MQAVTSEATVRLATACIGAVRLGIPVDSVVQAMPLPALRALLPRRENALHCIVEHEGVLVPVVDLARWVDAGASPPGALAEARILILRAGGRSIGLKVDTVDGLADVAQGAIARLHHDDNADEVFHSAAHLPDSGGILSLLDVARLADLAASWHQPDPGAAAGAPNDRHAQAPAGATHTPQLPCALLQLDNGRLGVALEDLVEVITMPPVARFGAGIDSAYCLWRGRHLPVLPASALPGLPDADAAPLLAVLERAGLALGLPVRAALSLQALAAAGPRVEQERGAVGATTYDADGAALYLLDTAALFARFTQATLSAAPADDNAGARKAGAAGVSNDAAYVVYSAGSLQATPIAGIEHILPLPPATAWTGAAATMLWRKDPIRLVDLRPAAQRDSAAGHVLVATDGAATVGYVVTRVELLVPAGSARLFRMGARAAEGIDFVTVDTAGGQASYRIVDLARSAVAA